MIPRLVSHIFDPFIVFTGLFLIILNRSGITGMQLFQTILYVLCTVILPPMLLLFWAVKTKRVTNWDVSDRKQRVWVLGVFAIFLSIDSILFWFLGNQMLFQLFIALCIFFAGFFLITLRLKLSGHMATAVFGMVMLRIWYGERMDALFLLLPVLAWSRLVLKRHTVIEVVIGTLYAFLFCFVAWYVHLI